jgi:hypothetical protein
MFTKKKKETKKKAKKYRKMKEKQRGRSGDIVRSSTACEWMRMGGLLDMVKSDLHLR